MVRPYLISTEKAPNPGQELFKARVIDAAVPIEKPLEEKAQPLKTPGTAKLIHARCDREREAEEQVGSAGSCQHICCHCVSHHLATNTK